MQELTIPTTQKAKGIAWLSKKMTSFTNKWKPSSIPHYFYKADFTHQENSWHFPVFARPCPVQPRHGFVDSRVCNSLEELNKVHQETLAADPQGEVAITEPIRASHSAILAGNLLAIGKGNDAATGGRKTHTLHLVNTPLKEFIDKNAPIDLGNEIPFFEFVYKTQDIKVNKWQDPDCICVQMRSVPKTANLFSPDYIPEDFTVTNVITAGGDLLEWEKLMTTVQKGTVVNAYGSSLASHYAIHAVLNKVPIVTSFVPKVGTELKQTTGLVASEDKSADLYKGFSAAIYNHSLDTIDKNDIGSFLARFGKVSIAILHNSTALLNAGYIYELGLACGLFVKTISVLCYGEARHFSKGGMSREAAYILGSELEPTALSKAIIDTYLIFCTNGWASGFGGKAWGNIILGAIKIWNACIDKNIQIAISELNKAINLEHNGGWCMNKVLNKDDFNFGANFPGQYALKYAPTLYEIIDSAKSNQEISYPQLDKIVVDEDLVKGSYLSKSDPKLQSISLESIKVNIPSSTKESKSHYSIVRHSWPVIKHVQIRYVNKAGLKIQYILDGNEDDLFTETDIPNEWFSKQAPSVIKSLGYGPLLSLAKTEMKYHKLELKGKKKETTWFCLNGKRILSLKKFCKFVGWPIPEQKIKAKKDKKTEKLINQKTKLDITDFKTIPTIPFLDNKTITDLQINIENTSETLPTKNNTVDTLIPTLEVSDKSIKTGKEPIFKLKDFMLNILKEPKKEN